uniref:Acid ceramidase n=2 Tax=Cacopsylla melanoneura TaxID=428564 RepID=A0A8D9EV87_9HEMI
MSPILIAVVFLCTTPYNVKAQDSNDVVFYLKNGFEFKPPRDEFPPFQGCYDEEELLVAKSKNKIPTYNVNLDLPPDQRWTELVLDKQDEIANLLSNMKNHTDEIFGHSIFRLIDSYMPLLGKTLPRVYYEELAGVARDSGVTIGEMTVFNLFYEFFSFCTSIVMEGKDGQMYHGRNLDFGLFLGWDPKNQTWLTTEYLRPLVVNVDFLRNNETIFSTTTFAGYLGILTAVKKNTFSLTVNERFKLNGGYVGIAEWIFGHRSQRWMGLLTRQVMEEANSFQMAQEMLTKPELVAPVYFILAGNETKQGILITRGRSKANTLAIGSNRTNDFQSWYLVQTNYDHWEKPPFYDDRRGPAVTCMNKWGQDNPKRTLYNVLSTRPVLNKLTVYTSIMNVVQGSLSTHLQDCKSPCWPW